MATFIYFVVMAVISIAIQFLFTPKLKKPSSGPQGIKPAGLDEFQFPTAEEGRMIPVVFGTRFVGGANVTMYANLSTKEIKELVG
jgi:hypothetical protein